MIFHYGFNPCFNGYSTFTRLGTVGAGWEIEGFNPCFNGYSTFTRN